MVKTSINRLGAQMAGRSGLLDLYFLVRSRISHSRVAIVTYHRVSPKSSPWLPASVEPEDFEKEIHYLHRVAEVVPLEWLVNQLCKKKLFPGVTVCVTLDDGYQDNYRFAYPILRKYGIPATIFLTTGYVGNPWPHFKACYAIWNTDVRRFTLGNFGSYSIKSLSERVSAMRRIELLLDDLPEKEKNDTVEELQTKLNVKLRDGLREFRALSWDEIKEMSNNGVSFGAHTVTHTNLTRLSTEEARKEIVRSKKDIEDRLQKPCNLFAYPNGRFDTRIAQVVKESGFSAAFTTVPRLLGGRSKDLFLLPRVPAGPNFYTFKGSLSGLYPDLASIVAYVKNRM